MAEKRKVHCLNQAGTARAIRWMIQNKEKLTEREFTAWDEVARVINEGAGVDMTKNTARSLCEEMALADEGFRVRLTGVTGIAKWTQKMDVDVKNLQERVADLEETVDALMARLGRVDNNLQRASN